MRRRSVAGERHVRVGVLHLLFALRWRGSCPDAGGSAGGRPAGRPVWIDRRRLQPGIDWDEQIVAALRGCLGLLYVMTPDSVSPASECKKEWTRALKYNKPVIPLLFHKEAELPFRLEPRQYIDFTHGHEAGLARLREHVRWRATPEGVLQTLRERLEDTRRSLARADAADRPRLQDEVNELDALIQAHAARPAGA